MEDNTALMIARAIGSVSGSIMALAGEPPESRADFYRRLAVSIPAGIIFADWMREFLHMADTWFNLCSGGAIAAAASWFVLAMGIRISKIWKPK